jgi:hypothetical protein
MNESLKLINKLSVVFRLRKANMFVLPRLERSNAERFIHVDVRVALEAFCSQKGRGWLERGIVLLRSVYDWLEVVLTVVENEGIVQDSTSFVASRLVCYDLRSFSA